MAEPTDFCPEEDLAEVADLASRDSELGLRRAETLLADYDEDPRLHFLRGSLLAALQRYAEAERPMREAVEIAPDFHIARFQLGLLLLTSGEAEPAAEAWAPLSRLSPEEPLRLFAEGLQRMAQGDFETAQTLLREGLARNVAHPPLNGDMQMVLDQMREGASSSGSLGDEASSQAHWLLHASAAKGMKH
jgi:Flp pilus assembly protein TadD